MDLKKVSNYQTQVQQVENNQATTKKPEETNKQTETKENQNNVNQDYIKNLNANGVANNVNQTV